MENETNELMKPKRDYFLPISILVAGLIVAGAVVFGTVYKPGTAVTNPTTTGGQGTQPTGNTADIMQSQASDVVMGSANAPVTMIEYGDYQCPYCAAFFAQTEPLIVSNYVNTGKVKFIFRNLIVNDRTATDHESHDSALAAACAADQNKFWQMHDAIYNATLKNEQLNPNGAEGDGYLSPTLLMGLAQTLGLDQTQFNSCFNSAKYASSTQAQSDQAIADGADATPTFYINGTQVVGAQPYSVFQQAFTSAGAK